MEVLDHKEDEDDDSEDNEDQELEEDLYVGVAFLEGDELDDHGQEEDESEEGGGGELYPEVVLDVDQVGVEGGQTDHYAREDHDVRGGQGLPLQAHHDLEVRHRHVHELHPLDRASYLVGVPLDVGYEVGRYLHQGVFGGITPGLVVPFLILDLGVVVA